MQCRTKMISQFDHAEHRMKHDTFGGCNRLSFRWAYGEDKSSRSDCKACGAFCPSLQARADWWPRYRRRWRRTSTSAAIRGGSQIQGSERQGRGQLQHPDRPGQGGSQIIPAKVARPPTIIIGGCTGKMSRLLSSETTDGRPK